MQNIKILNSKEVKHILELLKEQYGFDEKPDYAFLINKDNKIYIVNRDIGRIDFQNLRTDSFGLYFGELYKERIRLSIEGAFIIGQKAKKNVIYVDEEQMHQWMKGLSLEWEDVLENEFIIIKHKNKKTGKDDILGCGKYSDGKILNYISKSRKLKVVNY